MPVTDTKTPYEILVRFGLDGMPKGAHCQYLRRVVMDGEVLKEEIGQAEPLDLENFPTSAIMSDTLRDALAQVTTLGADKDALTQQLDAAGGRVTELTAEKETLAGQVRDLQAQVTALSDRVSAGDTDKAVLTAQLAAANQERDGLAEQVRTLTADLAAAKAA